MEREYEHREVPLHYNFASLLAANGITARVTFGDRCPRLYVKGPGHPEKGYDLTKQQFLNLTRETLPNDYRQKKAWDTFCDVTKNDFDHPSFVGAIHAPRAGRTLNMGITGYRTDSPSVVYGYGRLFWPLPIYGRMRFTTMTSGYSLGRTSSGELFYRNGYYSETPGWVSERADGSVRHGELLSGDYGFTPKYNSPTSSKDQSIATGASSLNASESDTIRYMPTIPRSSSPAIKMSSVIRNGASATMPFTPEKWREVLASHGLVIDETTKELVVQSEAIQADCRLSIDDYSKLMNPDAASVSLNDRIAVINATLAKGYESGIDEDFLNSERKYSAEPNATLELALSNAQAKVQQAEALEYEYTSNEVSRRHMRSMAVQSGPFGIREMQNSRVYYQPFDAGLSEIMPGYGWYYKESHGRQVEVSNFYLDKSTSSIIYNIDGKDKIVKVSKSDIEEYDRLDERAGLCYLASLTNDIVPKEMKSQGYNTASCEADHMLRAQGQLAAADIDTIIPGQGLYRSGKSGRSLENTLLTTVQTNNGFAIAVVGTNGQKMMAPLTEKEYDSFLRLDDASRWNMACSKIPEVALKETADQYHRPTTNLENAYCLYGGDLAYFTDSKMWYGRTDSGQRVPLDVQRIIVRPGNLPGKYEMLMELNGEFVTQEISEKEFKKITEDGIDGMERLKRISKASDDVKIEDINKRSVGLKVLDGLLAGTAVVAGITIALNSPGFSRPLPPPGVLYNPMVDTPSTVFERQMRAWESQDMIRLGY